MYIILFNIKSNILIINLIKLKKWNVSIIELLSALKYPKTLQLINLNLRCESLRNEFSTLWSNQDTIMRDTDQSRLA